MNINLNNTDNNDYVRGFKDGKKACATEYAIKLHQERQKTELLIKSRQSQNEFIDKAVDLLEKFLKKYDYLYEWKDGLYREIKTFLDGTK